MLSVLMWVAVAKYRRTAKKLHKTTDESAMIRCSVGMGELRVEVWMDAFGK